MDRLATIRDNALRVREKVENAAAKRPRGKVPDILLATKTVEPSEILFAVRELGFTLIGENRVGELVEKYEALKDDADIHLIGHLQTNKVRKAVGKVSVIESVDSVRLAREIDRISEEVGTVTDVLMEINIGREAAKGGIMPEAADEFASELSEFSHIRPIGIMTMAPICEKIEQYRRYFAETYQIFLDISQKYLYNTIEPVLSMGMSGSYEAAVLEGATQIRVGSAVFGNRSYH